MKSDSQIKQDILAELKWDAEIDETKIGVIVNNGFANVLEKIKTLPEAKRAEIEADIADPGRLVGALRALNLDPDGAVMLVGNGFHEVRDRSDARMIEVFRGYAQAGFVLLFTEESALSVDDLREAVAVAARSRELGRARQCHAGGRRVARRTDPGSEGAAEKGRDGIRHGLRSPRDSTAPRGRSAGLRRDQRLRNASRSGRRAVRGMDRSRSAGRGHAFGRPPPRTDQKRIARAMSAPRSATRSLRYSRQEIFTPIGRDGQERLRASRVAIVGCGALGSQLSETMVRAGVGLVRLIDRDIVEESNLQRQTLFTEADAAALRPKALAAKARLATVNSDVVLDARVEDLTWENARELLSGIDLFLDGTAGVSTSSTCTLTGLTSSTDNGSDHFSYCAARIRNTIFRRNQMLW